MSMRLQLLKIINLVYKRELDPKRVARTFHEYDINRGYSDYHALCKKRFSRKDALVKDNALNKEGVAYIPVLNPEEAQELIRTVTNTHEVSYIKKDTKNLEGYHLDDPGFIKKILTMVLTDEVDKQLISFFESEYLVHWLTFSKTPKAEEQKTVSFRWHCDKGPAKHLKIIVYLNPSAEHAGNTEFINLDDTIAVGKNGYVFGWTHTRTSNIQHLSEVAGQEVNSVLKDMQTGEGVVFQPANVLHRGVSPTQGDRYAITLNLLPSPVHWQTALESNTLSDLAVDGKWHTHANELLDQMKHLH